MIYTKIQSARNLIKGYKLKKLGHNDYSNYDYYTPEQVNKLVFDACTEAGLFNKFQLLRTELGLMAQLEIIDLETSEKELFQIATEIPEIKATNVAQQLGGAVTYSERYLLMIAYDIKDNNLDFDSQEPKGDKPPGNAPEKKYAEDDREWLQKKTFDLVIAQMNDKKPTMVGSVQFKDNQEIYNYVDKKYKMKKEYRAQLKGMINAEVDEFFDKTFGKTE